MRGNIFTLASSRPFLNVLAEGLLAAHPEPHELAQVRVFMPTRRAVRALERILLAQAAHSAVLLPQLEPLGAVDDNEGFFDPDPHPEGDEPANDLAGRSETQAVFARRLLFAKIVDRLLSTTRPAPLETRAEEALALASALTQLLEEAEGHGVSAEELVPKLEELVPDALSARWQENRKFLKILNEVLPALEKENGLVVLARRHKRQMAGLLARWEKTPPDTPIYVAGSTGSIETTAQLIARVASLPKGVVLLPGLDRQASDAEWEQILCDPPHPQFALARLIERLGLVRADIEEWRAGEATPAPRTALIQRALAPAAIGFAPVPERGAGNEAQVLRDNLRDGFAGLQLLECENEDQEARAIALALRAALEEGAEETNPDEPRSLQRALSPARLQALLVTPSQRLIQQVTGQLREWNLRLDNASGVPLSRTPSGAFLLLTLEACEARWSPVLLLSVLRNPLTTFGLPRGTLLALVSALESRYLRGANAARNLDELLISLRIAEKQAEKRAEKNKNAGATTRALLNLLGSLRVAESALANLVHLKKEKGKRESRPITEAWQAHRKLVTALCGEKDSDQLFAQASTAGERRTPLVELPALRRTLTAIESALFDTESAQLPPNWYGAILRTFLAEQSFHAPFGDTRIALLSPMEARLLTAKTVVLGGLNEKGWPPAAESGPWVSHGMRHALGLPSPEARIGRSAHDFAQATGATRVVLTRAKMQNGQPQVASRWVLRLQAMAHHLAEGEEPPEKVAGQLLTDESLPLRDWLAAETQKATRTRTQVATAQNEQGFEAPRTNLADWPKEIGVTQVATLKRNPYEFFARHILGLRETAGLEAPLSPATWGSYLHELSERLAQPESAAAQLYKEGKHQQAKSAVADLARDLAEKSFRQAADELALRRGRILGVGARFLEQHHEALLAQAEVESETRLHRAYGDGLSLVGRADRIERLAESGVTKIIDLKSGVAPSEAKVVSGEEPQLPLLAALLQQENASDSDFVGEYWVLRGGFSDTQVQKGEIALKELSTTLWDTFATLLLQAAAGEIVWAWGEGLAPDQSGVPHDQVWRQLARRLPSS